MALRWCSGSTSMVVSTPSSRIPERSHNPLTPAPVPTSTTALPPDRRAKTLRSAPTAGVTGSAPRSTARSRAAATMSSSEMAPSAWLTIASTGDRSALLVTIRSCRARVNLSCDTPNSATIERVSWMELPGEIGSRPHSQEELS
ncbi:Uncharacterised protein [Mycobacteroides abscessus subsp. abscessus]|nr:Uncharacterised protein [Mycobacteroides abscessus subsp. abscessus]